MEWVETTGRTVEEAKDQALDQLGVDEQDAEFEVVDEPKSGLFGRVRREARVRARIRPTRPRPKVERRDRRRKSTKGDDANKTKSGSRPSQAKKADSTESNPAARSAKGSKRGGRAPTKSPASKSSAALRASKSTPTGEATMSTEDVTVTEQADIMSDFLDGLLDAFNLDGELAQNQIDDDTIELQVAGDDLGLLIGPKGHTLVAVQELARTVVQRRASGTHHGRVRIDVGGYRQRRREALARFTQQVAEDVKSSGQQKALEPMNAADRKVVHDTANDIEGVRTLSEGEDPHRRVVIAPS